MALGMAILVCWLVAQSVWYRTNDIIISPSLVLISKCWHADKQKMVNMINIVPPQQQHVRVVSVSTHFTQRTTVSVQPHRAASMAVDSNPL